jgi:hypothetical protein
MNELIWGIPSASRINLRIDAWIHIRKTEYGLSILSVRRDLSSSRDIYALNRSKFLFTLTRQRYHRARPISNISSHQAPDKSIIAIRASSYPAGICDQSLQLVAQFWCSFHEFVVEPLQESASGLFAFHRRLRLSLISRKFLLSMHRTPSISSSC